MNRYRIIRNKFFQIIEDDDSKSVASKTFDII